LPTKGDADRLQDHDDSVSFPGVCGDERWEALGEDAALAAQVPADEFPHYALDAHQARPPGEVGQVALVAAMDRG
jgi:hypothetical protein